MKALAIGLFETETLSGPVEHDDIKILWEYLVRIKPVVIRFDCSELQVMYQEVEKPAICGCEEVECTPLLSIKTGSFVPADDAKADISIISRFSMLTLKLPQFHVGLLK